MIAAGAGLATILLALLAVAGVIFHGGYTWYALGWLKKNAATKDDIRLLRAEYLADVEERLNHASERKVDTTTCEKLHAEMEKRHNQFFAVFGQRVEAIERSALRRDTGA